MTGHKTVRVAITDSGITPGHPHLGAVAGGIAFVPSASPEDILDRMAHGTAVAGAFREATSDTELYAVKVFDRRLSTRVETLLEALKWCAANGIDVVNLSLGTGNMRHLDNFARILDEGVLAVSVAGKIPGCLPRVIAVGADERCQRGSFRIEDEIFFTSPYPRPIPGVPVERNLQGNSFAVANMTGIVARLLAETPREQLIGRLRQEAISGQPA
jgi:hypothetical protein